MAKSPRVVYLSGADRSQFNAPWRLDELTAVRRAVGKSVGVAIDGKTASGICLPACAFARAEPLEIFWFEEPLWYDDVVGHAALARSTLIPVALGEKPGAWLRILWTRAPILKSGVAACRAKRSNKECRHPV